MRQATLYTIHSQRDMCGDYVEVTRMTGLQFPAFRTTENDALLPVEPEKFQTERLPVYNISRIEHGARTTDYIALSSELREILEAPFVEMLSQLEYEKGQLIRENNYLYTTIKEYDNRLKQFNTANWFQRVWFIMSGKFV